MSPARARWTRRSRRCRLTWPARTWRCCCCRPQARRVRGMRSMLSLPGPASACRLPGCRPCARLGHCHRNRTARSRAALVQRRHITCCCTSLAALTLITCSPCHVRFAALSARPGMLLPWRPDSGAACMACSDLPGAGASGTLDRPLEVAIFRAPGRAPDQGASAAADFSRKQAGAAPSVTYQPISGAHSVRSWSAP